MPDINRRDYYMRRKTAMESERQSFMSHWQDLSKHFQPRRGRFFISDRNKGDKRYGNIINSRGTQALRIARSGLLAGVMSPSRPWFKLTTPDPDMTEFEPVARWLHDVELIMREIFNQSNLYNMAPVLLQEILLFGTSAMMHVDDFEDVARFYTFTAGDYMIGQNDKLIIDTFCREIEMQVGQIVSKYGLENVSTAVKMAWDRGEYDKWYPVTMFIEPNPNHDPDSPMAGKFAYRTVTFEPGNINKDQYLHQGGFREFPIYTPRWDVTGQDIYATDCPGMTALGDVKGLQIEERRKAQAIDKMVNPPLKGPSSLRTVPINTMPGSLTTYDGSPDRDGLSPIYQVQPRLQELMLDIEKVERRIDEAFYVDMFLAISNIEGIQPRNQLDLAQRNEERLLQLGPVLERFHGEFLDKLIDRTFAQMVRSDILPPPPEELQGQELKVEYISSLAMAQRAVATGSIERVAAYVSGLIGSGFDNAGDKFNAEQSTDEYARAIGVAPGIIRSDEDVAEIRKQREQELQEERAMAMAEQAAGAVQKVAGAANGLGAAEG